MSKIDDFLNAFNDQESGKQRSIEEKTEIARQKELKRIKFEQKFRKHYTSVITPVLFKIKTKLKNQFEVTIDESLRKDTTAIGLSNSECGEVKILGQGKLNVTIKIAARSEDEQISFKITTNKIIVNDYIKSHFEFRIDELNESVVEETIMEILQYIFIE